MSFKISNWHTEDRSKAGFFVQFEYENDVIPSSLTE